ncbi:MAG: PA14 domain-containing protein, partial [Planctomycetota bacterium]
MRRLALLALVVSLALSSVASATMLREIWYEQNTGNLEEALAVVNSGEAPTQTDVLDIAGWPGDDGSNYVARATGWIIVPTDGEYTFWVAADDHCGLWVSQDGNPPDTADTPTAFVDGWTSYQEWGKYDTQKAEPMQLTEGQVMAVTGVMREGGGGDNFAIGWTGPGFDEITLVSDYITHLSDKAGNVSPANGATNVINAVLTWVAPGLVDDPIYDLSFGTDPDALELIAQGIVETSVDVGSAGEELDFDTTYYWRVDTSGVGG